LITLNSDKGLIRIESWDDIVSRPGFTPDIDPNAVELKEIIGNYRFTEFVQCGLSSCHTKHFKGYVVSTVDGRETNIGNDCGKTHFGVDFETLARTFDREMRNKDRREKLIAAQHRIDGWLMELDELKKSPKGASWLNEQIVRIRNSTTGFPEAVRKQLRDMVKTKNSSLTRQRLASASEIESMKETGQLKGHKKGDAAYIEEEIGMIDGLSVLYPGNNIRELLIKDLYEGMVDLKKLDVDQASDRQLQQSAKWIGEIDKKMGKCRSILITGRRFFEAENIALLAELVSSDEDEQAVMKIARIYRE